MTPASITATPTDFAYALNETVEVTLAGRIVERKQGPRGNSYWVEKDLPGGQTARQWFAERDVYPADVQERAA